MKKQKRRCKHCGCLFDPCPRVAKHEYCSKEQCKKARNRAWQKKAVDENPVYRKDQEEARQLWRENNPDYWRKYRERNKKYTARNREKQRDRNRRRRDPARQKSMIANMDAKRQENKLLSGTYRLIPLTTGQIANMDAIIVEINDISASYNTFGSLIAKMDA